MEGRAMRKISVVLALIAFVLLCLGTASGGIIGDINNDGKVDLAEALYALQIAAGIHPDMPSSCVVVGRGDWKAGASYKQCDVVKHDGSYYICTQSHISTKLNCPPDTSLWAVLALKGDPGPQGEQGPPGPEVAYPNRLLVGPSGGDYTSIQAALNAIEPTADGHFIIEVAPGEYTESVRMKSFVHLKGSGIGLTTLKPNTSDPTSDFDFAAVSLDNLTDVTISGFTITGLTGGNGGAFGILDIHSSPTITNNLITAVSSLGIAGWGPAGIYSQNSSPKISKNSFVDNGRAIYLFLSSSTITENYFEDSGVLNNEMIFVEGSSAFISNNTFIGGEKIVNAVDFGGVVSSASIAQNAFTDTLRAISYHGKSSARIVGNIITGLCEGAISAFGPAVISGNSVEGCASYAIAVHHDSVIISDNVLRRNGLPGASAIFVGDFSPTIKGNVIEDGDEGIRASGGKPTITGNVIRFNEGTGIYVASGLVSGNTIDSNGGDGINGGTTISGNIVLGNQGHGVSHATTVTGNTITGNQGDGVCYASTITGNTISGNRGNGVFQGTTVTGNLIGSNNGLGVMITGDVATRSVVGNAILENGNHCIKVPLGVIVSANMCSGNPGDP
jgi:hypothetical protein